GEPGASLAATPIGAADIGAGGRWAVVAGIPKGGSRPGSRPASRLPSLYGRSLRSAGPRGRTSTRHPRRAAHEKTTGSGVRHPEVDGSPIGLHTSAYENGWVMGRH